MSTTPQVRVLCVDDNEHVAQAVELLIARNSGFCWLGWLSTADDLVDHVQRLRPDIVLLDLDVPGLDPLVAASRLSDAQFSTKVVVFSGHVRKDCIDRAIDAGVWGYASKNDDESKLLELLSSVMAGNVEFSQEVRDVLKLA
ncbi:MAG: response regulator transcription factor [Planctomycetota bacterium]|nr:response regulator transcription factor [Planctomycetota bacterium]